MRIGIFFGGQSREREISFAGGRTVYDNLNKELFEAVPIFVDSLGHFILLDWQYIYKGTIRDFYPPHSFHPYSPHSFQLYLESLGAISEDEMNRIIASVGKRINPSEFTSLFDFAFLALHGPYGEDGNIQGILEWYNIPYSGAGILPSAIGINKTVQQGLMKNAGFARPENRRLSRKDWFRASDKGALMQSYSKELGWPLVVKASSQGSSIGVTILDAPDVRKFAHAVNRAFFIQEIETEEWNQKSPDEKIVYIRQLTDIREGIGLPVMIGDTCIYHPDHLLSYMDEYFGANATPLFLESLDNEDEILIESFIHGKEFSCIVIQDEQGIPMALPPTEIIKGNNFFDYRSKYLPGMSRKQTPIQLPLSQIQEICKACEKLFTDLSFNVYARLDGFITAEGKIFLNDPNTTSGMLPSSFFFHQAAEIGLNPSQFLTYIIRTSLAERIRTGKKTYKLRSLLNDLDMDLERLQASAAVKTKVAVFMGGFSSERHISVESGRNIYEKLSSSTKYQPLPVFLSGDESQHRLFLVPVNIMLKDNADDIRDKVFNPVEKHPAIKEIQKRCESITQKYAGQPLSEVREIHYQELSSLVDAVFIALHGRPGEDGAVQAELEKLGLPYNGSGVESSQTTINKFETNRRLREAGVHVANSMLVYKQEWENFYFDLIERIESQFKYPFIAKPSDDGCSSAVKKIKNRDELVAYARLMFGWEDIHDSESARVLKIRFNEEFPLKTYFMIEDIIQADGARHFLEVTGGMLSHVNEHGDMWLEVFEPSETLATGEILSLEEKFLAGEGQNITPARFAKDEGTRLYISQQVREQLKRAAQVLNVQGYCRIDAFVRIFDDNHAEVVVIEINSLPGMTPATCIFHQTAINGYKPYDFIDRILTFGKQRTLKSKEVSA
ncbi:MAG: D-alanine--D-alanine ligase [Cytophagaceae bacterium]|jgi:D-alanine-D-alanine ligase|nr:D-alanine--D-alanine ligase [Cytophagaceae bacterium]